MKIFSIIIIFFSVNLNSMCLEKNISCLPAEIKYHIITIGLNSIIYNNLINNIFMPFANTKNFIKSIILIDKDFYNIIKYNFKPKFYKILKNIAKDFIIEYRNLNLQEKAVKVQDFLNKEYSFKLEYQIAKIIISEPDLLDKKYGFLTGPELILFLNSKKFNNLIYLATQYIIDIDAQNKLKETIALLAVNFSDRELLKLTIEFNANLNIQDNNGNTCLIVAVFKNDLGLVKDLVRAKADINLRNKRGQSALLLAIEWKYSLELIKFLIDSGANVNLADYNGNTPLITAICQNSLNFAAILIKSGADLNIQNNIYKYTALHFAIEKRYLIATELLISNKADINLLDYNGNTPLIIAVLVNQESIIKLLLNLKADLSIKNKNNKTALDIAKENYFFDIANLLK